MFTVMFSGGDTINGGPGGEKHTNGLDKSTYQGGNFALLEMHDAKCTFIKKGIERNPQQINQL